MWLQLLIIICVAMAIGFFQFKVEMIRAERMLELLHKELEEQENNNTEKENE